MKTLSLFTMQSCPKSFQRSCITQQGSSESGQQLKFGLSAPTKGTLDPLSTISCLVQRPPGSSIAQQRQMTIRFSSAGREFLLCLLSCCNISYGYGKADQVSCLQQGFLVAAKGTVKIGQTFKM